MGPCATGVRLNACRRRFDLAIVESQRVRKGSAETAIHDDINAAAGRASLSGDEALPSCDVGLRPYGHGFVLGLSTPRLSRPRFPATPILTPVMSEARQRNYWLPKTNCRSLNMSCSTCLSYPRCDSTRLPSFFLYSAP